MGTYDPPAGADDTERVGGGILNAMMNFPAPYTFTVICRAREEALAGCTYQPGFRAAGLGADRPGRSLAGQTGPSNSYYRMGIEFRQNTM